MADEECGAFNLICKGTDGIGNAVGGAVNSAVQSGAQNLGETMMGAWDSLMKDFLTSWINQGMMVDLNGSSVPWLTSQLSVITLALSVVGIMCACIWTMLHYRGDRAKQAAEGMLRVFLVTALGVAVAQLLIPAFDQYGKWILDQAGVTVNTNQAKAAAAVSAVPGVAIIAGLFGALATLFQWMLMLLRAAVLPLLIAFWPTAAAAAMIRGGEQAFSKLTAWIIAFILYKPVAATIYAFAWKLKNGDDGTAGVINGLLLIVLAVAALPALMRLIVPATGAMGGSHGGGMAMAAGGAAAGAAVAVGATVMTGGGSTAASAASGGGGSSTASGTSPSMDTGGGGDAGSPAAGSPDRGPSPGGSPAGGGSNDAGGSMPGGSSGATGAAGQAIGGAVASGAQNSDAGDLIGD